MPELPEVETMRRGIQEIVGSRVEGVERVPCRRRPVVIRPSIAVFRRRVVGRTIIAVERLGKRVAIRLDNDDRIVFEPRMTGLILLADPPSAEHLRFHLGLSGGSVPAVWYWDRRGLGNVRLYSPAEFSERSGVGALGPDALEVSRDGLAERLRKSRREIKVALLDQRAVAGIGNLYASEILHLAGIHPQRRCDQVTGGEWSRLHKAMGGVLEAAIRYEGSTLSDRTYRNALNQTGGYQQHHRVYDRAGELCLTCGKFPIEQIRQAQRSTFLCRNCQPRRPRRAGSPLRISGKAVIRGC